METILTFLETTSLLRPLHLMAQMSHTDLAIAFLLSKPIFVATAALLIGGRSLRKDERPLLESPPPHPPRLHEDP